MSLDHLQHGHLGCSSQDKRSKNEFSLIVIISLSLYPLSSAYISGLTNCQLSFVVSHGISHDPDIEHMIKNLRNCMKLVGIFFPHWSTVNQSTMGQNRFVLRHLIIHSPTSLGESERINECSGVREQSKQGSASEWVSGASERTSEWPFTYVSIHGCSEPQCRVTYMRINFPCFKLPTNASFLLINVCPLSRR